MRDYLQERDVASCCHVNHGKNPLESIIHVGENYGLGPLRPNTFILPFQESLIAHPKMIAFIEAIHSQGKNIALLKSDCEINTSFLGATKKSPKLLHLWWEGKKVNNFKLALALFQ